MKTRFGTWFHRRSDGNIEGGVVEVSADTIINHPITGEKVIQVGTHRYALLGDFAEPTPLPWTDTHDFRYMLYDTKHEAEEHVAKTLDEWRNNRKPYTIWSTGGAK